MKSRDVKRRLTSIKYSYEEEFTCNGLDGKTKLLPFILGPGLLSPVLAEIVSNLKLKWINKYISFHS